MRALVVLACVVACGDERGALLSTSRVAIEEHATSTRIHVDAPPDAVELPAIDGLELVIQAELGGTALDIYATCNAAHGKTTTLSVPVNDTRDRSREQILLVTVTDNGGDVCLADLQVWDEPCTGASCDDACGPPPPGTLQPRDFQLDIGDSHRICVRSTAVDTVRPLDGVALAIDPTDAAMEVRPVDPDHSDDPLALIVRGQPWLVGKFTLTVTSSVGTTQIVNPMTVQIGQPPAAGIEVIGGAATSEFTRSTVELRVHHFEGPCAIAPPSGGTAFRTRLTNITTGESITTGKLDCADQHARFSLAIVPGIAAPETLDIPIAAAGATAHVAFKVDSLADDLSDCPALQPATEVACADIDHDDTLEVVRGGGGSSCATGVVQWRSLSSSPIAAPGASITVHHLFALPTATTPEIWGIDSSNLLVKLTGASGARAWQEQALPLVGTTGVPFRRGMTVGPPDTFATLMAPKLRFVAFDGTSLGPDATLTEPNPIAIGAIRLASGPGIAIVNDNGTTMYGVTVYRVTLSTMLPPQLTLIASGVVHNMPVNALVEIAGRGTPNQDLVMVFYSGLFASAVTEAQINGAGISEITQYGGVGSISATPEATVLLGAELGSVVSAGNGTAATSTPIDPDPPTQPVQNYGRAIAPCLDKTSTMAGFVERTGVGARVAKRDIVPEQP